MEIILEITSCWVWQLFCNSYMCGKRPCLVGWECAGEGAGAGADTSVVSTRMRKYCILWQSCSRVGRLLTNRLQISLKYVGTSMQKRVWGPNAFGVLLSSKMGTELEVMACPSSGLWDTPHSSYTQGCASHTSLGWLCRIFKRSSCPLCSPVCLQCSSLQNWLSLGLPPPHSYLHCSKE